MDYTFKKMPTKTRLALYVSVVFSSAVISLYVVMFLILRCYSSNVGVKNSIETGTSC